MQHKRKISLTLEADVLNALEEAAKRQNMAKSHIAQKALELWLRNQTEALMAKGYEEMDEEDRCFAETAFDAQRETLS